jgi:hypothetical protein
LLFKILKAVDLGSGDVELVYSEDNENFIEDDFVNCKLIAFFSQVPEKLYSIIESGKYKIKTNQSNTSFLSDSLETINEDTALKRKLWDQLKVLYGIQ